MKKLKFLIFFLCTIFFIFIIFYFLPHNYNINYKIDNFLINQKYNNKTKIYSFKITNNDNVFLYSVQDKYYRKRKQISNISLINNILKIKLKNLEDFYIKKSDSEYYSLYYDDITNDKVKQTYKNIDIYNLNANFYIWNYNELINITNDNIKSIKLFNNDIYNLDLVYQFNNYLLIADYNNKYIFNKFYLINSNNNKIKDVKLTKDIYFDSYFLGNYKNNIYLYDKQSNLLYKINPFKETIEKNKFEYLDNNVWKKTTKNKLDKGNVSFINTKYFYYEIVDKKLYYITPTNRINVVNMDVSNIIYSDENICYFISNDTLYYVNKNKIIKIMKYSEWKFNNSNVYIFNSNN